jgi:hypothetical protein
MAPKNTQINVDNDVLAVLARMAVEGQILRPVSETLPRTLYEQLEAYAALRAALEDADWNGRYPVAEVK